MPPRRKLPFAQRRPRPFIEGRPRAVALSYEAGKMPAPTVTAIGQGEMAERIIALAKEHGVTIREDPTMVALLAQLDIGEIIPPELYPVVAEVLAFVYRLKHKRTA